jgi:tight adherence protein B
MGRRQTAVLYTRWDMTDYNVYRMSMKERVFYTAVAAAVIYIVSYIFYRSSVFSLMLCPLALLYPRFKVRELIAQRKTELNIQFKDMLYCLSSSLSAGKPVETAFRDVLQDLTILYPDPNTCIIREVEQIVRRVEMNETIESVLMDFSERSHIDDIESFVDVFRTCKRSGGNIVEIIRNTSNIISDKIEIKQEIENILAEKRLEQKVLNVMPLAMIVLLSITAGDYIQPVFTTAGGRAAMSISAVLIILAYFISKKITDIKV